MQTLPRRPIPKVSPDGARQIDSEIVSARRPTSSNAQHTIAPAFDTAAAPIKPVRPAPTFAAPVMAEPIAAPEMMAKRPIPEVNVPYQSTARELAEETYNAAASRTMVDKDNNPILNALKGFGMRFLQSKGSFFERLGGGAFGAVENTLIPDAAGNRGTMDERYMQSGRINSAKAELDRLTAQENSAVERASRQADLQNKALRPWQQAEIIRTKDEATEQRAQTAQARIDAAIEMQQARLGAAVKTIASEGKMWQIVNRPDANGRLIPSLQPLTDPQTGEHLDDPKQLEIASREKLNQANIASRESIASGRNTVSIKTAEIRAGSSKYSADSNAQIRREQLAAQLKDQLARRNITTAQLRVKLDAMVSKGDLTQSQADAAYADATSNTNVTSQSQATKTIDAIKRQGAETGKSPEEIAAKVQEFINSLPKAVRPR